MLRLRSAQRGRQLELAWRTRRQPDLVFDPAVAATLTRGNPVPFGDPPAYATNVPSAVKTSMSKSGIAADTFTSKSPDAAGVMAYRWQSARCPYQPPYPSTAHIDSPIRARTVSPTRMYVKRSSCRSRSASFGKSSHHLKSEK